MRRKVFLMCSLFIVIVATSFAQNNDLALDTKKKGAFNEELTISEEIV